MLQIIHLRKRHSRAWLMVSLLFLIAASHNFNAATSTLVPVEKKVLIVGAGPAGLPAAHCLLCRKSSNLSYLVHLVDARGEPAKEGVGPRAYAIGISTRGQNALHYFDTPARSRGLLDHVKALSVPIKETFLHIDSKNVQVRRRDGNQPPSLLLPRNIFAKAYSQVFEKLTVARKTD